jgi:hypothetical protein
MDSEISDVLTGVEMATIFREFDDLWEMPGTPERRARMEALLKLLEPKLKGDVADVVGS